MLADGNGRSHAAGQHLGRIHFPGTVVAGSEDVGPALDLAMLGVFHHFLGNLKAVLESERLNGL